MYYQQTKPIGLIKQEISRYTKHLSIITISSTLILPFAFIPLFLSYYTVIIFIIVIPVSLIASGIGFYRLYCVYKLGTTLEELGHYYMQEAPSAKEAGSNLKISLFVSLFFATVGYIFLAIAYYKIAETFKDLYKYGLYPKKESRLLFYSVVGSAISSTLLIASFFTFFFFMFSWSFVGPIIFVSLSGVAVLASFIAEIIGYYNLSNDVKEILERAPSTLSYQAYPIAPPGSVYHQPVYAQPVHTQPSQPQQAEHKPIVNPPSDESEILFCPECGFQIEEGISFCPKCGISLVD